jgi:hypothetical protein
MKKKVKKSDLYDLPNIGPRTVLLLKSISITSVADLKKIGAEKAYDTLCKKKKMVFHRAFLYVLRAALFYVAHPERIEEAKMWWLFRRPNEGGKQRRHL